MSRKLQFSVLSNLHISIQNKTKKYYIDGIRFPVIRLITVTGKQKRHEFSGCKDIIFFRNSKFLPGYLLPKQKQHINKKLLRTIEKLVMSISQIALTRSTTEEFVA